MYQLLHVELARSRRLVGELKLPPDRPTSVPVRSTLRLPDHR